MAVICQQSAQDDKCEEKQVEKHRQTKALVVSGDVLVVIVNVARGSVRCCPIMGIIQYINRYSQERQSRQGQYWPVLKLDVTDKSWVHPDHTVELQNADARQIKCSNQAVQMAMAWHMGQYFSTLQSKSPPSMAHARGSILLNSTMTVTEQLAADGGGLREPSEPAK